MVTAADREDFKHKLIKMKERLDEVQDEAGRLMLQKEDVLDEIRPLQAAITSIDYKLSMLAQSNDELLKQYTRYKQALAELERTIDMSVY